MKPGDDGRERLGSSVVTGFLSSRLGRTVRLGLGRSIYAESLGLTPSGLGFGGDGFTRVDLELKWYCRDLLCDVGDELMAAMGKAEGSVLVN